MGFRSAEEITLPARFLTTTAHLIVVLTILFDVRTLAGQLLLAQQPDRAALYSAAELDATAQQLSSAALAAVACFAVEYAGLFLGVSLFMRAHACLYTLLHFAGAVTVGLLCTQAWPASALVGLVIAFNCLPAALELLTFLCVARLSFFSY